MIQGDKSDGGYKSVTAMILAMMIYVKINN